MRPCENPPTRRRISFQFPAPNSFTPRCKASISCNRKIDIRSKIPIQKSHSQGLSPPSLPEKCEITTRAPQKWFQDGSWPTRANGFLPNLSNQAKDRYRSTEVSLRWIPAQSRQVKYVSNGNRLSSDRRRPTEVSLKGIVNPLGYISAQFRELRPTSRNNCCQL